MGPWGSQGSTGLWGCWVGPSSCVQLWVSSLGNPGDRGDRLEAEFKPACHQFGPSHGSWSGISDVLLALALALLFAREKGQAEAPARRAEGQRAQRARSHRGWGHLETLHCAGGGAHNTHTAAGQGPGSWQPAWGGKHRQKHQNRHNPRGPGWGRGAYAGGRPWLPWQEGSREVQHCSA